MRKIGNARNQLIAALSPKRSEKEIAADVVSELITILCQLLSIGNRPLTKDEEKSIEEKFANIRAVAQQLPGQKGRTVRHDINKMMQPLY